MMNVINITNSLKGAGHCALASQLVQVFEICIICGAVIIIVTTTVRAIAPTMITTKVIAMVITPIRTMVQTNGCVSLHLSYYRHNCILLALSLRMATTLLRIQG